jgi:fibronectin type 3 domain-containing protein
VIELYNRGDAAVSLAGLGITDNPNLPTKYLFPAGTTIPGRGYLTLYADSLPSQAGELHLGFGLDAEGDRVYLFPAGATVLTTPLDSVEFGIQLPNLSIGRLPDGTGTATGTFWGLAQPTLGGINRSQPLGNPSQLKINEWFTGGQYTIGGQTFTDDFIELYNASSMPVDLSGLYLTDNPADDPDKSPIAPLSYIAASGYGVFLADENTDQGANHTSFQLASERGWLGLFTAQQALIDQVLYLPQLDGTSQGRVPDGGPNYQFFAQPTPGLDSSPPSVPANLHFTLIAPTRNDIAWDASSDTQTGVAEYHVYRGGTFLASTAATSYSDTTVQSGTSYSYQVLAVNGDGVPSALSSSISSGLDSSPPSTPTGLAGTIASGNQIDLSWNASADPQSGVQHYNVYRNSVLLGTSVTTSFNDSTFAVGPAVTYRVSAVNNDDIESPHSLGLSAATFQDGAGPTAGYAGTTDTWLSENQSGTNNGSGTTFEIDGDEPQNSGLDTTALIRWDISAIPTNATVTAGALVFNVTNSTVNTYEIYDVRRAWNELQANWISTGSGGNWELAGARGTADRGGTSLGLYGPTNGNGPGKAFSLNGSGVSVVQSWIGNAAANFGFAIHNSTSNDGSDVTSREGGAALRPQFTVLYTTPAPADTTPPTVPTNIAASNDGASTITLFWNPSTDPDSGIASYNVFRNGVQIGNTTNVQFADAGRTPGVTYNYTVSAINNVSLQSAPSSPPVAHSIAVDSTPPSAPSGVSASDNGISQITISWTAATDAQSGVSQYRIYRDNVLAGTSATTTFADTGRSPNVTYSYEVAAVNGQNLEGARSTPAVTHEIQPLPLNLTLSARDSYLPGAPMLVRVEITGSDGLPDRNIWDATATLSSSNPAVTLSTTTVTLRNGVGSALVTPTGSGNFTLNASVPSIGLQSSKALTSLAGVTQTNVSGTLTGAQLNWSGVMRVTGNVIVPDGQVLNIAPGTLVLVDGAPDNRPSLVTNGITITVNGRLSALGTAAQPITFTTTGPTLYWGEINHSSSDGTSNYAYVDVLHAGHSPGGDHTGHGPAIRSTNSTLDFDHANISDIVGKTMRAQGSNLTFRNSIFTRSVMGPETFSTGILFENSYIFDMLHTFRQDNQNDDDDGIYVHRQGAGQEIRFSGCIVANTEDDGIDQLGADIIVENCIIRDMVNVADDPKGITIIEGTNIIRDTLIVNVDIGISAKGQGGGTPVSNNTVDHVTIVANSIAIQAEDKFGIPGAIINYDITNSILRAPDAVASDYAPGPIVINYSNLSETWPGTGNQTADPLFVNAAGNDYHLQPTSPAINAGDPASPLDPDGTRTDMGFYPFSQQAPKVAEVMVRGTSWTPAMLARLGSDGLGSGGYRVPIEAGPNFAPLPWTGINQIMVRFTEGVTVAQNDLVLAGVNVTSYPFTGFTYDPATFTATWTRTQSIAADKLRLTVNDSVVGLSGTPLDGELGAAYPSGNNSPGGDFSLRFDVLPGDANQNRVVDGNDFQSVLQATFNGAASAAYRPLRDLDANGAINILDLHSQLSRQGTTLPAGNPPPSPPAPSAPAAVVRGRSANTVPAIHQAQAVRRARPLPIAVDQVFSDPENSPATQSSTVLRARRMRKTAVEASPFAL